MLNLRRGNDNVVHMRTVTSGRSSTVFRETSLDYTPKHDFTATVIGNLGEAVSYWGDEVDDDDDMSSKRGRPMPTRLQGSERDAIEMDDRVSSGRHPADHVGEDTYNCVRASKHLERSSWYPITITI